jgi:hypothetical protein
VTGVFRHIQFPPVRRYLFEPNAGCPERIRAPARPLYSKHGGRIADGIDLGGTDLFTGGDTDIYVITYFHS